LAGSPASREAAYTVADDDSTHHIYLDPWAGGEDGEPPDRSAPPDPAALP
jgi:hypothetical protein